MLFLHEVHEVVGAREEEFEESFRDVYLPALTQNGDARLLYFLHHAHGTGVSYNVVTVTALRDASAWQRLHERVHSGDLAEWAEAVDGMRHDVTAKLLVTLPWSPLQEIDFATLAGAGATRRPAVFMEDTVWPYEGRLSRYIEASGTHYASELARHAASGNALLEIQASFRTAFGSGRRREIVLWQKLVKPEGLTALVSREVPLQYKEPGTWLHDALELRDRWESKLLRTARWSPLG